MKNKSIFPILFLTLPSLPTEQKDWSVKGWGQKSKKIQLSKPSTPLCSTIKLYKLWQNIQNVKLFWGHPEGGKYLVWFVGSGWWWYDDTWRLSTRARHRDYFCCSPFSLSAGIQSQSTALFINMWSYFKILILVLVVLLFFWGFSKLNAKISDTFDQHFCLQRANKFHCQRLYCTVQ